MIEEGAGLDAPGGAWARARSAIRLTLCISCLLALAPAPGEAQGRPDGERWGEIFAGGELESYLRVLQLAGEGAAYPWSIRGFSPLEVGRIARGEGPHPWARRVALVDDGTGRFRVDLLGPTGRATYNSAFPYGSENGAVWTGRGVTTEISGGFAVRAGPFTLTAAPVAFWAQNAEYALVEHVVSDRFPYADPKRPTQIDLPQRFGDAPVSRLDPGQTTLRAEWRGLTAGLSHGNQVWGPAEEYPIVLGANAPGFAHGFAGTSRPMNLWIARVHGRLMWGRLEQSDFSTVPADSASRFTTAILGVITPRGVPGLEIGGVRFFHMPWPKEGIGRTQLLAPLETFLKQGLLDQSGEEIAASILANQLVSVFARWTFPASGVEVYGEFATEDHRHNLRDLVLQPDHDSAYTLGLAKVWRLEDERWLAIRAEWLDASASHLGRNRRQEPFYIHAATRQGHTQLGQVLGSPAAYGGAGSTLELDLYHAGGRATLSWRRLVRRELDAYLTTGVEDRPDVIHGIGAEALVFRGRWDVTAGVQGAYNLNRDFERDVLNLNLVLGVRAEL